MKYDSESFSRLIFVLESRGRIGSCANSSEACCFKHDRFVGWSGLGGEVWMVACQKDGLTRDSELFELFEGI